MIPSFSGLYTAVRGLNSSQAGLTVTNNNISNANTDGYSRETLNQTTSSTGIVYNGKSTIGAGSEVKSIDRVRDMLLDKKYWRENGSLGEWDIKSNTLTEVEQVFSSSSSNGFTTVMDDFYAALEDLSENASDTSTRTNVMETGKSICTYLNDASARLNSLRDDVNTSVKTTVNQINAYAQQIGELNDRIMQATATGATANDLEDQRDLLIDKLSALADVSVTESTVGSTNKTLMLSVNGSTLVNGKDVRQLACDETSDGIYEIRWTDSNETFDPGSGELKGYLDLRDGTGSDSSYQGIPYYMNRLNEFARTFAEAFNEGIYKDGSSYYAGHAGGYGTNSSTGIRFFTYDGSSSSDFLASGTDIDSRYANITAANISISSDVEADVNKIAASSTADEAGNNENIDDLLSLCQDNRLFATGTPEDFMNTIISAVGTESAYAQRLYSNKTTFVKNVKDNRSSVSGVSTNEETANLTKYQQIYNANAKMVSMWSEIFETTIDMVND